jgi:hypothetical protein
MAGLLRAQIWSVLMLVGLVAMRLVVLIRLAKDV